MIEMSSGYAHESEIGPVFDVATFSPRKAIITAIVGTCFAAAVGGMAVYVWNPDWIVSNPAYGMTKANQEIRDLWRDHPRWCAVGVSVAGLLSAFLAAVSGKCWWDAWSGGYYLRASEAGLAMFVPNGWGLLKLHVPWTEVEQVTVTQEKRLGSLSRSAGNIGASLSLRLSDGREYELRLDHFRQDGWLIHERLQEAQQMRAAALTPCP